MHIAIYHNAHIPPAKYGGTERAIFWLTQALIALGNRVTLIVREGSFVEGAEVRPIPEDGTSWESCIPEDADILHLWATPGSLPKKPFLITIEGNGRIGEVFHPNTVFVSRK